MFSSDEIFKVKKATQKLYLIFFKSGTIYVVDMNELFIIYYNC